MVEVKTESGKLKARIDVERNIDDFGYAIKMYFPENNQAVYIKLSKRELQELSRDIHYLLAEN